MQQHNKLSAVSGCSYLKTHVGPSSRMHTPTKTEEQNLAGLWF